MFTQAQFEALVTERLNEEGWDVKQSNVRELLDVIAATAHDCIKKGGPVKIRNLVTINVRRREKTGKRMGRNPATGEEIVIAAKPASTRIQVSPHKITKDALPTPQALAKALARK